MATIIATTQLFPSLLPAVTFSAYIGLAGQSLSLSVTVAALVLFEFISKPLIDFPIFMGDIVSLLVSMRRIDKFLELKEVQPGIIERGSDSE